MDVNSRFQQLTLAGGQSQARNLRAARPVVVMPGSGQDRTYMNVKPVAVATKGPGQVPMIDNTKGFVSRYDKGLLSNSGDKIKIHLTFFYDLITINLTLNYKTLISKDTNCFLGNPV